MTVTEGMASTLWAMFPCVSMTPSGGLYCPRCR
jgi:hypothetical protein